jgi:NAD(P) transhydrogenase subunit alpha
MYAKNVATFLKNLLDKESKLNINREDEIIRETLVTHQGEVAHARIKELMTAAAGR